MYFNLWGFLVVAAPCATVIVLALFYIAHQQKIKKLEIERQKIEKINIQNEVEDAVNREVGNLVSRIEVLEAIVTDKNYDLNDKITRLK